MIEKLKDKYVFFDVDGTLNEYRYHNKVYVSKNPNLGCRTLEDLLFGNLFINSRPLKTMQNITSKLNADKIFILGTVVCNNEINQKLVWLEKNYPWFKKENMVFISSTMLKPEVIVEYSKKYYFNLKDAVFIDDRLDVLRKAEEMGITVYHPSSFME